MEITKESVDNDRPSLSATSDISTNEEDSLLHPRRVTYQTAVRLRIAAIAVSWASIVTSVITGVLAIFYSYKNKNQSLLAYGLEALLDCSSSIVVLWRFYDYTKAVYSVQRERAACIVIAVLFLVASGCLLARSIVSFVSESKPILALEVFHLALVSGFLALFLAVIKLVIGYKLESRSLRTDSVITFISMATSFTTAAHLKIYAHHHKLWFLDAAVGIACGILLLGYGVRLLVELSCCWRGQSEEIIPLK